MTTRKAVGRATKKCSSATSENQTTKSPKKKTLKRDTLTISASEVNRFTYCQYQWYYERLYGRTEMLKQTRDKSKPQRRQVVAHTENKAQSNFSRGRAYHRQEYIRFRIKRIIITTLMLVIFFGLLYLYIRMRL